ncbi:MAG: RDD family protein [Candidatus Promineifilaceae bacterium]
MDLDELLNIDTPENVVFGYEIAGIGSRFMAALVDTIIIVVMLVIVNLVFLLLVGLEANWIVAALGLISFVILWGYYIFFEMNWGGQTPGKRWVGLRVIRVDGTPISLSESLIRNLIRFVDFLPVSYGIGVVTMFITSQSRRLGDLAAGTIVVWEREKVTLDSLALETRIATTRSPLENAVPFENPTGLPLEKLTDSDIQMAENFLSRRYELPNRIDLGVSIERALYNRMEVPMPPVLPPSRVELRLQEIVKAYRGTE